MGDAPHAAATLRRPTLQWLVATVVLVLAMFLVLQDLVAGNQPHEMHNAPWVAGIALLNSVPCAGVFVGLKRYATARREAAERSLGFYALVLGLFVVGGLNTLIFVGAAGTMPAVLGG